MLKKMGRKFLEKRPNSAFSTSRDVNVDNVKILNDRLRFTRVCACCTCAAALVDEGAQSLAHGQPQIWTFVDGHPQGTSNSFEG